MILAGASALFWMYVAYRAMRAHERLAQAAEEIARRPFDNR